MLPRRHQVFLLPGKREVRVRGVRLQSEPIGWMVTCISEAPPLSPQPLGRLQVGGATAR